VSSPLPYLAVLAIVATTAVLVVGVVTFALGPGFSARYGTRLMTMRVILQGVAIALLALMVLL
jgi:hypothetical protein